ncbi:hypothetical protein KY359_06825 [Candidatus Woesearchaeota archaeon]|nr:hypothetical protein [Candidatus Woesearchaeota archaeon]
MSRAVLLCAAMFVLWYIVMLLISWYDPALHLVATFSSAIMVGTGNSWGIVNRIVS